MQVQLPIYASAPKKIIAGNYFLEICLVTGLSSKQTFNVSVAGVFPHSGATTLYVTFCILQGTFSSGHVYPQSGACPGSATHVSADGLYWVETLGGCSDTVAVIARRYDLDVL